MKVYLGTDHRGFALKEEIKKQLVDQGVQVTDLGAQSLTQDDDYTDFAHAVAEKVADDSLAKGIILCGSGVGVDITANKVKGIRSCLGFAQAQVKAARNDDDVNVLALPADYITPEQAKEMVKAFLETPFNGEERYKRRIEKIAKLE